MEHVSMVDAARELNDEERRERIEFWQSLPAAERERICIWFAKQFGEVYRSNNPEFKLSKPVPSPPEVPSVPLPKLQLPQKNKKSRGLSIR